MSTKQARCCCVVTDTFGPAATWSGLIPRQRSHKVRTNEPGDSQEYAYAIRFRASGAAGDVLCVRSGVRSIGAWRGTASSEAEAAQRSGVVERACAAGVRTPLGQRRRTLVRVRASEPRAVPSCVVPVHAPVPCSAFRSDLRPPRGIPRRNAGFVVLRCRSA